MTTYKFLEEDPRLETLAINRSGLGYANFNKESQDIIKEMCRIQIQSFKDICNIDTLIEIRDVGYDVTLEDLNADTASQIEEYTEVLRCPNKLFILDEVNLGLFKHNLFNEYYETSEQGKAADIWRALTVLDEIEICLN